MDQYWPAGRGVGTPAVEGSSNSVAYVAYVPSLHGLLCAHPNQLSLGRAVKEELGTGHG